MWQRWAKATPWESAARHSKLRVLCDKTYLLAGGSLKDNTLQEL
jgi:hypothetical protein